MNKLNILKDSPFEKNHRDDKKLKNNESKDQLEKVLCKYCGRTASNGMRCLGFCVADNDY